MKSFGTNPGDTTVNKKPGPQGTFGLSAMAGKTKTATNQLAPDPGVKVGPVVGMPAGNARTPMNAYANLPAVTSQDGRMGDVEIGHASGGKAVTKSSPAPGRTKPATPRKQPVKGLTDGAGDGGKPGVVKKPRQTGLHTKYVQGYGKD